VKFTEDTFFNGRLNVRQHRAGYRYSIDAVILAACAEPGSTDRIVDLGTGCGIIPMILAFRYRDVRIYGIEIQAELADIAEINIETNQMDDRIQIIKGDMKSLHYRMLDGPADLVLSNPPYRKVDTGRINPDKMRAVARHEITITLDDVVNIAKSLLKTAGKFVVIYPAWRMTDLLICMRQGGIEPKKLRSVHSRFGDEARLVVVEGIKGGRPGLVIEQPVYIYKEEDVYTDEIEKMFLP